MTVTITSGSPFSVASGSLGSGQSFTLVSGVVGSGILVDNGGTLLVAAGGSAVATTIFAGGSEAVHSNGVDMSAVVSSGGSFAVSNGGIASQTDVVAGGTAMIDSGGSATGATVRAGGQEIVSSGGTARSTTIFGTETVLSSGIDSGAIISSGGTLAVASGGSAVNTRPLSGGLVEVSAGGSEVISAGGSANNVVLLAGGMGFVISGNILSTTIQSGAVLSVTNGIASDTQILSGGQEIVAFGGNDISGTVSSGGLLSDTSNATNTTVQSGGSAVFAYGGHEIVSGGVASGVYLISGGQEIVSAGGSALGTHIQPGGGLDIGQNGVGSGNTIEYNGAETIEPFGSAVGEMLMSGGQLYVSAGGIVTSAQVMSGGLLAFSAGKGTIDNPTIDAGGTLEIGNGGTLTGAITFAGSGGKLLIDYNTTPPTNPIVGFDAGGSTQSDSIVLGGLSYYVSASAIGLGAGNVLTVTENGSSVSLQLDPTHNFSGVTFRATSNTLGQTVIIEGPCYAAGTRIATPAGEVPVERLRPGDDVLTLGGAACHPRRVRWVGQFTVDLTRHPWPERAAPVRIRAHAFADCMPARDLLVSPDHALLFAGAFIHAGALLNGLSIVQDFPPRVTYWHVELDRHSVLLAEGLPAESYLDLGNRGLFDGEPGTRPLHPDLAAQRWTESACAPLLLEGERRRAAHARLLARAQELARDATAVTARSA